MAFKFHHLDKWGFANLDLIQESLEKNKKAVVIIGGASSSGKSYASIYLKHLLENFGYRIISMSLDQYDIGLSGIVPNKVNLNFFDNSLENMKEIREKIKKIIYNRDFDKKYDADALKEIRIALKDLVPEEKMDRFIQALDIEWKRVNFDETSVYDLHEASEDIKKLLNGESVKEKMYSKIVSERVEDNTILEGDKTDIIIIEGIYALNDAFVNEFEGLDTIKNFVDGNPKSLFLRRIIRDLQISSASTAFTINLYFKYIVNDYNRTILPSRSNADVILNNDMTFAELRAGELYNIKDEVFTSDDKYIEELLKNCQILSTQLQKDIYFSVEMENQPQNNILRLRELSFNNGKSYYPSSLVHKGALKIRKDKKLIRPINVLLNEEEITKVWKQEEEVLSDFLNAGFSISKMEKKTKIKAIYKDQPLTIRKIEGKGAYIEFDTPIKEDIIDKIKKDVA